MAQCAGTSVSFYPRTGRSRQSVADANAIDAFEAFDERQAGWIKVELKPSA
jgi:threonine dehydrogenase-like Zn-dependent dehydrogenase